MADALGNRNKFLSSEMDKNLSKLDVRDEDELGAFLLAAERERYYIVYELAASTGMRTSEILGLRWVDVDLHSDITVTLDICSHVLPNLQEAVLKGLGDSIVRGRNENEIPLWQTKG
ncbi:tyrosine-type recombinase/integrase [Paenibacillus sepulcri]|uniref:Tyrosine-type recombinase/integrase n=1 Tax=Paenibacillus sepulcri TaxID=359917 RepID=A0ABS7CF79_9BACL|nr:tyrosine-type recombinase/integrase [Paenibacillus sepulcri]